MINSLWRTLAMFVLLILAVTILGCASTSHESRVIPPLMPSSETPSKTTASVPRVPAEIPPEPPPVESHASRILRHVTEADQRCRAYDKYFTLPRVETYVQVSGKGKSRKVVPYVADRPVVLCGFRERDQSWHVVEVHVSVRRKNGAMFYDYTPVQSGYSVKHLSGRGVTRLIFDLEDHAGHITVYRTKHLWFTKSTLLARQNKSLLPPHALPLLYTPYHPDFRDPELVEIGAQFLYDAIVSAQGDLRARGVRSFAFPLRLMSEVIPWEVPMALGAIEQMDDGRFLRDSEEATDAMYAEYALNGESAFRWSVSSADALGAFQFTNQHGNGTYAMVVRRCGGAGLTPDFEEGARDLHNVIKAAICLLDMELALLPEVHPLYLRNPTAGAIYPVAAYNGGHGWGLRLYRTLSASGVDLEGDEPELPDQLTTQKRIFVKVVSKKNGKRRTKSVARTRQVVNAETAVYVQKYMYLIDYITALDIDEKKMTVVDTRAP